jgi:hypothetical protein
MSSKCKVSDWLSGIGSLLTGVAAIWAVCIAKEPITNYFSKVTQTVIVNTCEAKKQADLLIEKASNPEEIDKALSEIPQKIDRNSSKPMGLFIAPEFRDAVKLELESSQSADLKRNVLKNYWEKSLNQETKSNVDLKFNGE